MIVERNDKVWGENDKWDCGACDDTLLGNWDDRCPRGMPVSETLLWRSGGGYLGGRLVIDGLIRR